MPTYDYQCLSKKCAVTFEAFQSIMAKLLKKCEKCGGKVHRLIGTGGGIIFKGTGFYATDYKKSESKSGKKNASETKLPPNPK